MERFHIILATQIRGYLVILKFLLSRGCCYIFPRLVRGRPSAWPGGRMRSHDDDHCFVMIFIQISFWSFPCHIEEDRSVRATSALDNFLAQWFCRKINLIWQNTIWTKHKLVIGQCLFVCFKGFVMIFIQISFWSFPCHIEEDRSVRATSALDNFLAQWYVEGSI